MTYHVVSGPAHGTLTGRLPFVSYASDPAYIGEDRFVVSVDDGINAMVSAAISITVTPQQQAPSEGGGSGGCGAGMALLMAVGGALSLRRRRAWVR